MIVIFYMKIILSSRNSCFSPVFSYGLCWGCVESPVFHNSASLQPSLSQAYGIKSRVPLMMTYKDEAVRPADNIPFDEFVPDSEDFIRVRDQMKREVQKILISHLELFSSLTVTEDHQYSALVSQKSHMVSVCRCDNLAFQISELNKLSRSCILC